MYKIIIRICLGLVILAGAACASSGGGSPGGEEEEGEGILIQVRNDVNPPTGIVVWVVPETGNRRRLGFVSPNGQRSFRYSPALESIQIYLLAEPEGPATGTMGQTRSPQSNLFSVLGVQSVSWITSQPNVRIGG